MTTLVYRDGVLAADSRGTRNGMICPGAVSKVYIVDGRLVGFVGDTAFGQRFVRDLREGREPADLEGEAIAVIVDRDGGTVRVHQNATWYVEEGRFAAWGTGLAAALGALHMGATADQAVEAACEVDPNSGGPVQIVSLRKRKSLILENFQRAAA